MPTCPIDDDLLLFYTDTGEGSPVLLLHASLSTGQDSFGLLLPQLARGHRVLCPDLRGHGRTRSPALSWNTPMLARDMLAFLGKLGIEKAHLVGHSMGGDVAMLMAAMAPERCLTVTSIGSAGSRNPGIAAYLARLSGNGKGSIPWPRIARQQAGRHRAAHGGDWRTFLRMTLVSCIHYPDFSDEDLGRIAMPFLLVHGSRDALVGGDEIARLARLCPRFAARCIEGAGHAPQASPAFLPRLAALLAAHLDGRPLPA